LAIDFPTPTQVGQVYTDPTSGNTYICIVLGPPAEWSGSSDTADLDQTYLRTDATNGPVSGNLGVGGTANAANVTIGTGGSIAGPNTSTDNKWFVDANGNINLGGSPTTPNLKLEPTGAATLGVDKVTVSGTGQVVGAQQTVSASAWDLAQGNNWTVAAVVIPQPTNGVTGQSGTLTITAAPTSWPAGGTLKYPGGSVPTIASYPAVVPFYVQSPTAVLLGNVTQGIS
jgi:hypothetical protein